MCVCVSVCERGMRRIFLRGEWGGGRGAGGERGMQKTSVLVGEEHRFNQKESSTHQSRQVYVYAHLPIPLYIQVDFFVVLSITGKVSIIFC